MTMIPKPRTADDAWANALHAAENAHQEADSKHYYPAQVWAAISTAWSSAALGLPVFSDRHSVEASQMPVDGRTDAAGGVVPSESLDHAIRAALAFVLVEDDEAPNRVLITPEEYAKYSGAKFSITVANNLVTVEVVR